MVRTKPFFDLIYATVGDLPVDIRNITLLAVQNYKDLGPPLFDLPYVTSGQFIHKKYLPTCSTNLLKSWISLEPVQSTKGMFNMVSNSTRHILSGSHDGFKKDCQLTVACRKYCLLTVTCRKYCLLTDTCRRIKALCCERNSKNLIGVCYCQGQRELCWF